MTRKLSQNKRILALLRERGRYGITPKEALTEVGTMRLAARIADLRAAGHVIHTQTITTLGGARVARYVLADLSMRDTREPATVGRSSRRAYATWDEMRDRLKAEAEKRKAWEAFGR